MRESSDKICSLADDFFYGNNSNKQNYEKAMTLYKKAADMENAKAQYMIGYLYHYGLGVSKDYKEAFYWLCKAASKKYLLAEQLLDLYYENGFHIWR